MLILPDADDDLDLSPSTARAVLVTPPPRSLDPKFDPNLDVNLHPEEACA